MGKQLTKSDVYDTAMDLIEDNGTTSTLEVKMELRNRGFFAKQADVSEFMLEIADEEKWSFTYNGVHRVYTIDTATATVTSNQSLSNQLKNANAVSQPVTQIAGFQLPSYTKRNGTVIQTITAASIKVGDYKVFSLTSNKVLYFSGNAGYSRSDIRFAYAKIENVNFIDTRIKKYK